MPQLFSCARQSGVSCIVKGNPFYFFGFSVGMSLRICKELKRGRGRKGNLCQCHDSERGGGFVRKVFKAVKWGIKTRVGILARLQKER